MKLYAISNKAGEYYKGRGWWWTSKLSDAKIYKKEGQAKAQITNLSTGKYTFEILRSDNTNIFDGRESEIPKLVVLEVTIADVIPQVDRVKKAYADKKAREIQSKRDSLEEEIKRKQEELSRLTSKRNEIKDEW